MADFKEGLGRLLEQAQGMQSKLEEAQKKLKDLTVVGSAGTNPIRVSVEMNGQHQVRNVEITPEAKALPVDALEDMLVSAFNDALQKVETESRGLLGGFMGDFKMPEGFPNLFGGKES